ncbi:MAG: hypothetical protein LBD37_04930 [Treponema sp.]|nr:hypothetical protein [Treponema sp.]
MNAPSGAIKEALDEYGLRAEVDDFGPERPWRGSTSRTDLDFILERAKTYG